MLTRKLDNVYLATWTLHIFIGGFAEIFDPTPFLKATKLIFLMYCCVTCSARKMISFWEHQGMGIFGTDGSESAT